METIDDSVAIADLVDAVKLAIVGANLSATDVDRTMRVSAVAITLNTVAVETNGGGIDFRVPLIGTTIKFGRKVKRTDLHKLEINLVPPPPAEQVELRDSVAVAAAVFEAIENVRAAVATAATGDDPFGLKDGSIEITFGVDTDGFISVGYEGNLVDQVTHTLKVTLSPA